MNFIQRKSLTSNISAVIQTNHIFTEFIESIIKKYPLHTTDEENFLKLQEHLNNMTVIFNGMNEKVQKK